MTTSSQSNSVPLEQKSAKIATLQSCKKHIQQFLEAHYETPEWREHQKAVLDGLNGPKWIEAANFILTNPLSTSAELDEAIDIFNCMGDAITTGKIDLSNKKLEEIKAKSEGIKNRLSNSSRLSREKKSLLLLAIAKFQREKLKTSATFNVFYNDMSKLISDKDDNECVADAWGHFFTLFQLDLFNDVELCDRIGSYMRLVWNLLPMTDPRVVFDVVSRCVLHLNGRVPNTAFTTMVAPLLLCSLNKSAHVLADSSDLLEKIKIPIGHPDYQGLVSSVPVDTIRDAPPSPEIFQKCTMSAFQLLFKDVNSDEPLLKCSVLIAQALRYAIHHEYCEQTVLVEYLSILARTIYERGTPLEQEMLNTQLEVLLEENKWDTKLKLEYMETIVSGVDGTSKLKLRRHLLFAVCDELFKSEDENDCERSAHRLFALLSSSGSSSSLSILADNITLWMEQRTSMHQMPSILVALLRHIRQMEETSQDDLPILARLFTLPISYHKNVNKLEKLAQFEKWYELALDGVQERIGGTMGFFRFPILLVDAMESVGRETAGAIASSSVLLSILVDRLNFAKLKDPVLASSSFGKDTSGFSSMGELERILEGVENTISSILNVWKNASIEHAKLFEAAVLKVALIVKKLFSSIQLSNMVCSLLLRFTPRLLELSCLPNEDFATRSHRVIASVIADMLASVMTSCTALWCRPSDGDSLSQLDSLLINLLTHPDKKVKDATVSFWDNSFGRQPGADLTLSNGLRSALVKMQKRHPQLRLPPTPGTKAKRRRVVQEDSVQYVAINSPEGKKMRMTDRQKEFFKGPRQHLPYLDEDKSNSSFREVPSDFIETTSTSSSLLTRSGLKKVDQKKDIAEIKDKVEKEKTVTKEEPKRNNDAVMVEQKKQTPEKNEGIAETMKNEGIKQNGSEEVKDKTNTNLAGDKETPKDKEMNEKEEEEERRPCTMETDEEEKTTEEKNPETKTTLVSKENTTDDPSMTRPARNGARRSLQHSLDTSTSSPIQRRGPALRDIDDIVELVDAPSPPSPVVLSSSPGPSSSSAEMTPVTTPDKGLVPSVERVRLDTPSILKKPNSPLNSEKKGHRVHFASSGAPSSAAAPPPSSPSLPSSDDIVFPPLLESVQPIALIIQKIIPHPNASLIVTRKFLESTGIWTIGDLASLTVRDAANLAHVKKPQWETIRKALTEFHEKGTPDKANVFPIFTHPAPKSPATDKSPFGNRKVTAMDLNSSVEEDDEVDEKENKQKKLDEKRDHDVCAELEASAARLISQLERVKDAKTKTVAFQVAQNLLSAYGRVAHK